MITAGWIFTQYPFFFFKDFIYFSFRERGRGERERVRNINVWLPLALHLLGTWPATQAGALMGNWTCDPLLRRPELNPLSYTSQGQYPLNKHQKVELSHNPLQSSNCFKPNTGTPANRRTEISWLSNLIASNLTLVRQWTEGQKSPHSEHTLRTA